MEKFGHKAERYNYATAYDKLTIRFDGSCEPVNPMGNLGWGWIICNQEDIIAEGFGWSLYDGYSPTSSNLAEWNGIFYALQYLLDERITFKELTVIGDSRFVIYQADGRYRINKNKTYSSTATRFLEEIQPYIQNVRYKWEGRESNHYCDFLSTKWMEYLEKFK